MFCLVVFTLLLLFVKQVTVRSLQDVISYFVIQTHGNLKPFIMQTCNEALQMDHSSESKTRVKS